MKKIGRKKASLISAIAIALVVSVALGLFMQRSGLTPAYLVFAGDSNPDSYGNYIYRVQVEQPVEGSWSVVVNIPYSTYTADETFEIDANIDSRFKIEVRLNITLASSASEAEDYTKVTLNLTDIYTNEVLTTVWNSGELSDWYVIYTSGNFTLSTDTVYDCTVKYEAYY